MVTPDGKPILLRGINLGNWLVPEGYMIKFRNASSPRLIHSTFTELLGPAETKKFWEKYRDSFITKEDIAFIKKVGLNSIRVPFNYRLFVSEDQSLKFDGPGMEMLDRVVQWCKEEHLFVIFDMHCAPGGQTGDNIDDSYGYPFLFESVENQELTAKVWRAIAARFADEPAVIGYDLLNEPIAPYFDVAKLNGTLEPLYKRIVASVREVDTNHICFLGGAQWNGNFKIFGPPFDAKLVYTYHKYWCDTTQKEIQEYVEFSEKYQVPVWLGESGENTDEWIGAFRRLNERNNFGWCFWPYKKMDATTCIASVKRTPEFDSVIAYANKPRLSYKDIREARPAREIVRKALNDYLDNCRFENCTINEGYLRALGTETDHKTIKDSHPRN
jgi:aryl-phospho-beta-D-glucosidase BglC (GH1 family)